MSEKVVARLEQQKFGKGKQSFILHEDGVLFVTVSKGGSLQHFSVSLMGWDAEPVHEKNAPKLSRIVHRIVFAMSWIPIVAMFLAPNNNGIIAMFILFIFFGIFWAILYSQYLHQSYDVLIFCNRVVGGQLTLHNNVPNEKEFSSFVDILKATIKKFPNIPQGQTHTTVSELREFARLRDDGILTNEEFEEAKRKLLSNMNSPSSMGFRP